MIKKYSEYIIEREFEEIFAEINSLFENGKWTGPNKYEWDFTSTDEPAKRKFIDSIVSNLEKFVSKLPKDKVQEYFWKFLEKIKNLPESLRKRLMVAAGAIFLGTMALSILVQNPPAQAPKKIVKEFVALNTKSDFKIAQEHVKISEAGYSDDRKDKGNWIRTERGKRFIGTKYGISAPILKEYLKRIPTVNDMKNLSYSTAVKIYKANYWKKQNLENFRDQNIANIIYDGCVNQGISGTKSVIRKALRDMKIEISDSENPFSENWIEIINTLDQQSLFSNIKSQRQIRYENSPTFDEHGDGWLKRLDSLKYEEIK